MDVAATDLTSAAPTEFALHELERRVHALEETVARLDDIDALEERVTARMKERLPQAKVAPPPEHEAAVIEERVFARLADRLPPPASDRAAEEQRRSDPPPASSSSWGGRWASWLFVDMAREGQLLVQMVLDRRYQMAWTTRIVALVFLPLILTSHWWLPLAWLPGFGSFFVSIVNLVLAFALYKALSREVRRYQDYIRR
jgi:hypothetical protein